MGGVWLGLAIAIFCSSAASEFPQVQKIHFVWIQPPSESAYANYMDGKWDDKPMSALYQRNMQSWRDRHPGWEVKLWDSDKCEALIRDQFPEMMPMYLRSVTIMKADLARMMILLSEGGLYLDLDCIPKMPFGDILRGNGYIFEKHRNAVFELQSFSPEKLDEMKQKFPIPVNSSFFPTRLANSPLYAGYSNSPFLQRALAVSKARLEWVEANQWRENVDWNSNDLILYTTGPDVITDATFRFSSDYSGEEDDDDVDVDDDDIDIPDPDPRILVIEFSEKYVIDVNVGSWKSKNDASREQQDAKHTSQELADIFFRAGLGLMRSGDCASALELYKQAIAVNASHDGALADMALCDMELGDTASALAHSEAATAINPSDASNQFNLGRLYQREERLEEAIQAYDHAIAISPDSADFRSNQGIAQLTRYNEIWGDSGKSTLLDESIANLRVAAAIDPRDGSVFLPLGDGLLKGERFAEAAQAYARGAELIPNDPDLLYLLGASHYQLGDLEGATQHWKRAFRINPAHEKSVSVLSQLGLLNEKNEL